MGVHATGKAVRIADTWIAGVDNGELANAINAGPSAARIEDRAFVICLAVLVATLPEAALIAGLAVGESHDTDAVNTTVIDARIVVLLAAAVAVGLARLPARPVEARFPLVAAAARIQRRRLANTKGGDEGCHGGAYCPASHAAREHES